MTTYTHEDWRAKAVELFGSDAKQWKFKCCNCGHEQSIQDFINAGIKEPETKVHFSCIGRWTGGEGTIGNDKSPCNYTIGGLFNMAEVVVKRGPDTIYTFDFGSPVPSKI